MIESAAYDLFKQEGFVGWFSGLRPFAWTHYLMFDKKLGIRPENAKSEVWNSKQRPKTKTAQ